MNIIDEQRAVEVLLPDPNNFVIRYSSVTMPIDGFKKIIIQFQDRVNIVDGVKNVVKNPLITYHVLLSETAKDILYRRHSEISNASSELCMSRKSCEILLGKSKLCFKAFINFIPRSLNKSFRYYYAEHECIFVEMDFDRVRSDMYRSGIEEFYKEYVSRYEIMEIS